MSKRKIVLLATALCMIAILAVGGTLAYFTDTAEVTNVFTTGDVDIDLTEDSWKPEDDHILMPGHLFAKDPTITVAEDSQDAYVFLKIDVNKYVKLVNLMGVDAYKNKIGGLSGNAKDYPGFILFCQQLANDNALRAAVLDRWFEGINHSDWKVMNLDDLTNDIVGAGSKDNPEHLQIILGYIGSDDDTLSAGESVTFMTGFGMPATVTSSMYDGEDAYYKDDESKSDFTATDASSFNMTFTAYAIQKDTIADIDAAYDALFN
ncbi:MAG: SipW-dependent-type signal peptide-containing protein [Aristaeellaceae bacterium]